MTAALSYFQALQEVERKGGSVRCWLLTSPSPLLESEFVARLTDKVVPHNRDFNLHRLDCDRDTTAGTCMAVAEELPVASDYRLLWLRGVQDMADAHLLRLAAYVQEAPDTTVLLVSSQPRSDDDTPSERGQGTRKLAEAPATTVSQPPPNDDTPSKRGQGTRKLAEAPATTVLLARSQPASDEDTPSKRGQGMRKLAEALRTTGLAVDANLKPAEIGTWLRGELERHHLQAGEPVRRRIAERVGNDLHALRTEVEKLACFLGDRKVVEPRDVDAIVTQTPASKIFDLSDNIGRRDVAGALLALDRLLEADDHPLRILAYLTTHFRGQVRLKGLRQRGESVGDLIELLQKPEWKVTKECAIVDSLSAHDLEQAVEMLLRADVGIKTGKDPRMLLELLTLKLCHPSGDARNRAGRN